MIEESLKTKISANEQKIKSLFTLKQKANKRIQQKNPTKNISKINLKNKEIKHKQNISKEKLKINSFISNKENQKNLINLELSPTLKTNSNININNKSIINDKNKFETIIKPPTKNNKKKFIPNLKYKELERFINIKNQKKSNSIQYIPPEKPKKSKNTSKSLTLPNNKQEKIRRNFLKTKSHLSNIDYTKRFSKSFDFNLTYERFIENEIKKNERISKLKKRREKYEKKIYPHQPKINQKSKNLTKSITDDFLLRLEQYKKVQIEKEENLKQSILKNEEEKINKNNYLKINRKRNNDSIEKIYNNNNKAITESVNKLYDWDKKRKEKIENEIKKQDLIEKNRHIPNINKSKNKNYFKKDKIVQKIFDRLYNKNKYMFEFKKEILTQQSTPKFQSLLNNNRSQVNISFNTSNNNLNEETNNDNNYTSINNEEDKVINNTDRIMFNNKKNENLAKEQKSKSLIVVIRKVKSQIDIINKKNK